MSDEHNGWPNRETWAAHLHLSNDQGMWNTALELTAQAVRDADDWADKHERPVENRDRARIRHIADALKDWCEAGFELVFHPAPGDPPADVWRLMASDVGSLWRVDWASIAAHLVDSWQEGQQ